MYTKSRFNWNEMFVGTSIVVYVENPEKDFHDRSIRGDFDKMSEEKYNALLDQFSAVSALFENCGKSSFHSFLGKVIINLSEQGIGFDNIVLIVKRLVDGLFDVASNKGRFILDGVYTAFNENGFDLSPYFIVYDTSDCLLSSRALNLFHVFDTDVHHERLLVFRNIFVSKVYAQHKGAISITEIAEDFDSFIHEKYFYDVLSCFDLYSYDSYSDEDWRSFEGRVQDDNKRTGLDKHVADPLVWTGDELLSVVCEECYFYTEDDNSPMGWNNLSKARKTMVYPGQQICIESNRFNVRYNYNRDINWLDCKYINGMSIRDILKKVDSDGVFWSHNGKQRLFKLRNVKKLLSGELCSLRLVVYDNITIKENVYDNITIKEKRF